MTYLLTSWVAARVSTCFPSRDNENDWYVSSTSPAFLVRPDVLNVLGIVPDVARATFTLEDEAGRLTTLDISPVPVPPAVNGVVKVLSKGSGYQAGDAVALEQEIKSALTTAGGSR